MSKILIVQFALGPTHNARLLYNLQTYSSYDYFDVFVMTDRVEYFNSISYKSNVTVKDLDELRKDYPWSLELEKLPPRIDSESEYADYFMNNNVKIPTLLRRFVFLWENAINYDGFIFMDCDVLPIIDDETYNRLETYFTTKEDKIVIVPTGGYYDIEHHSYLSTFANTINNKYKITNKEITNTFLTTDGNFRTLKFPSKEDIKLFFELLNNVIHDILTNDEFFILGVHTMWNVHSENVLSILFNLLEAKGYSWSGDLGLDRNSNNSFRTCSFPEDRFWNWGQNMIPSLVGRQDFIEKNYDKLKKYYEDHFQEFPY